MGRRPLPPEQRKPRVSGKVRTPTVAESAHQRTVMGKLAADVGAELYRRGLTGAGPASWIALARVLKMKGGSMLSRAAYAQVAKARYVRPETLKRWERLVEAWIAGEEPPPDPEEIL